MTKIKKLRKELEELDISKALEIDETDVAQEFTRQAARYAYWSQRLAEAERQLAIADNEKDMEYAAADEDYRVQMDEVGKKYTEAVVRSLVLRDETYQEALEEYRDAEYVYKAIRGLVKAFDQRASMLISLGATLRAEQDMTGMSINERKMKETVADMKSTVNKAKRTQH